MSDFHVSVKLSSTRAFDWFRRQLGAVLLAILGSAYLHGCAFAPSSPNAPRKFDEAGLTDGDILFQDSNSGQSLDIRSMTHSPYCHVGIYMRESGHSYIYHAGDPVGRVSFASWVGNGKGYGEASRLRSHNLTPEEVGRLRQSLQRYAGRHYDVLFQDQPDKLYCSEYVALAYREALGVDLGPSQTFAELHLSPEVKEKLKARYSQANKTYNENALVITPERIRRSSQLVAAKP